MKILHNSLANTGRPFYNGLADCFLRFPLNSFCGRFIEHESKMKVFIIVGGICWNSIPLPGHPTYDSMIGELVYLFIAHNENGLVKMEYETKLYVNQ